MIERIAQRKRHGGCPRRKLFVGRGVTCAKALVNRIRPHGPPLVMVAFQPDFGQVAKPVVLRDSGGRKVRMVIEDWFLSCISLIKPSRRFGMQKEIFVNEIQSLAPGCRSLRKHLCCHRLSLHRRKLATLDFCRYITSFRARQLYKNVRHLMGRSPETF